MDPDAMSSTVLRRRSWLIIPWIFVPGLAIGMAAAVYKVSSMHGFQTGWQGIPVYLALVGVVGRVANCKAVLREEELLVINPLRTYIVPKAEIRDASVGDDGTLELRLDEGAKVSVFAFGGSLVDRLKGTSGEAARRIRGWLLSDHATDSAKATLQTQWTRCAPADFSILLCAVIAGIGAIWQALSS